MIKVCLIVFASMFNKNYWQFQSNWSIAICSIHRTTVRKIWNEDPMLKVAKPTWARCDWLETSWSLRILIKLFAGVYVCHVTRETGIAMSEENFLWTREKTKPKTHIENIRETLILTGQHYFENHLCIQCAGEEWAGQPSLLLHLWLRAPRVPGGGVAVCEGGGADHQAAAGGPQRAGRWASVRDSAEGACCVPQLPLQESLHYLALVWGSM